MKLGGLFSGIGGFELAWTRLGGEVAWMCEWDKNARKVLEARFPGVPIYPDVRDLDPAGVEAVDVLTGGSPCQGFSVAGSRTGLQHSESQLFADYIRIMDGLAERGLKWALWENVPGVLSIEDDDGNRTFEHVVAALAGGTVPVRLEPERRWNTGLASGRGRAVAWRVLDSRFFGVAQRRRRVFACVAFGGACEDRTGRALLAVAEGVSGDSAEGVAAGQGAAGGVASSVGGASGVAHTLTGEGFDASEDGTGRGTPLVPDVAGTLGAKGSGGIDDLDRMTFLPDRAGVPSVTGAVTSKWAKGTGGPSGDEAQKLVTDTALGFNWQSGGDARGLDLTDQPSALTTQQTPAVLMTMREGKPGGGKGPLLVEEESLTLATGNGQTLFQPQTQHYGVRRLTPVECERLQAFPDGWTEPAGSDSARYKALGNAVTVNTVGWILRRMKAQG
jgi:DNA (cytosine-5)-methyltransferase 1